MIQCAIKFDRTACIQAGVVASLACLPQPAFGQVAANANIEQIAVTFDLRHFGNIARTSEAVALARGLTVADDRATIGAEVQFGRSLGRNTVRVNGSFGYDFHRKNKRLNRERIGLEVGAGINAGPCLLDISARVDRRQSDLETIALVNLPGIESLRNAETVQKYRGEARCGYVYGLRPLAGYERSMGDNSSPIRAYSDFQSDSFFAGLGYDHPVVGKLSLRFVRDNVRYPERAALPALGPAGYSMNAINISASRDIGANIQARASLGWVFLRPDTGQVANYNGTSWGLGANVKFGSRLVIDGSTDRNFTPSLGAAALYSRQTTYQLRANFALSQAFTLGAGSYFARKNYGGATNFLGPVLDEDHYRRYFASVNYKASGRLNLLLDGGHERRQATGTIYDYSGIYIGLRTRFVL